LRIDSATGCTWRGDVRLLASASADDGTVSLWNPDGNPPSSQVIVLFPPRQGGIQDIAITPEGRHLVTANSDGTISVLRLATLGDVFRTL
jgi:WD40 repeat protein